MRRNWQWTALSGAGFNRQNAFVPLAQSEAEAPVLRSIALINHYFGERKAHEEGSSCFLRRRRNGHDCSLGTDTG